MSTKLPIERAEPVRHCAMLMMSSHGYEIAFEPVGEVDPEHGAPTQMGVFRRCE